MQEITPSEFTLRPLDGVLLTKEYLQQRKKALDLYDAAKERARKTIIAAEKEAELIKINAQAEGRDEGILALLDIFTQFIESINDSSQALMTSCMDTLRGRVEELFTENVIIHHFISQWWQAQITEAVNTVTVRLHQSCKKLEEPVKAFLEEKGCCVLVQIDDEPGCHIKAGDFVLELSTDLFSQRLIQEMISSQDDFVKRIQHLSEETREKIKNRLTTETEKCM